MSSSRAHPRISGRLPSLLALLGFLAGGPAAAQSIPVPPDALPSDGAAYRTGKSMFFGLRKVEVVGTTNAITVTLEPDSVPGPLRVVVSIDATDFDSGEAKRDEWVAETLAGPDRAPLVFRSDPVDRSDLLILLNGGGLDLGGTLLLPEGPRRVNFSIASYDLPPADTAGTGPFIEAYSTTTFDALGITVPKVGPGGAIASPGDNLELWFRVPKAGLRALLPEG